MKRLSQTWKQKRIKERNHVVKDRLNRQQESNNDKENEGIAKVNQISTSLASPCSSFNLSFGFEFDASGLSEVDKIENAFFHEASPKASVTIPKDRSPRCSSSQFQQKAVTPQFPAKDKSESGVSLNRFGQQPRERISTPIEDSEHIVLFPPAHSPVFSPLSYDFEKFETGNNRSRNRSQLFETSESHKIKSQSSAILSQSQSRSILEVDTSSSGDPLLLSSWGLPPPVLTQYNELGIRHMFEWQAECLRTGKVLCGGNLVYSAPTSAGKTMIAELLMLKRVLEVKRKALFILPFISVAREKMFYLQRLFQEAGVRVEGYMGNHSPAGGFASVDIAVCTIEKANGLLNRLLEERKAQSSLGIVVVDEMHMIGDPHRGYLLELFLTKIRYIAGCNVGDEGKSNKGNHDCDPAIQIVGMSATLPNLDMLAKWLSADLYFTDHRPVPLTEMIKVGSTLYDSNMKKIREVSFGACAVSGDEDHVIPLCKETIAEGCSVLVFCPTKNWCEKLAESIAKHFFEKGNRALHDKGSTAGKPVGFVKASTLLTFDYASLKEVIEQLKRTQVGLDSVLSKTVPVGVGFHHAGLTFDERDIIEGAFRQGFIRVLVATSTLSSGVNLPARRVIIRTPMFHGKLVDSLVYKQMAGRAGRKGVDALGESILMCKPAERQKAASLLNSRLKAVQSCLLGESDSGGIKRALLEVIASGIVTRPQDVERYAACTFFASSTSQEVSLDTDSVIKQTVQFLLENEFVRLQRCDNDMEDNKNGNGVADRDGKVEERYVPTQLGMATLSSALSPSEALAVFVEVQKARKCFVLESELHIIYQVTPIYIQDQWPNIDWYQYLRIWERLPAHMRRVADLVGIEEAFLVRAVRGRILTRTEPQRQSLAAHRKFYAALALQDLVHEVPLHVVAQRYGTNRGMLQSLQGSASTFAGMVTVFCEKLGWSNMALLLSQFQSRLSFGVERELCDLVRITLLNAARARMLYNAGYHSVSALAAAPASEIENVLRNAAPFVSGLKRGQETETEVKERNEARVIWVAGRRGLTEEGAAKVIVAEAKQLLQADLAELGVQWKPPEANADGCEHNNSRLTNLSALQGVRRRPRCTERVETFQVQSHASDPKKSRSARHPSRLGTRNCVSESTHGDRNRSRFETTKSAINDQLECDVLADRKGQLTATERSDSVRTNSTLPKPSLRENVDVKEMQRSLGESAKETCNANADKPFAREASSGIVGKLPADERLKEIKKVLDPATTAENTLHCVTSLITNADNLQSGNKRRSPRNRIAESPLKGSPQEKLQKRENPVRLLVVESQSLHEETEECLVMADVALSDSKGALEDVQCTSVELYSESFDVEELSLPEKPSQAVRNDNNAMPEVQPLAGCSLSDSCLMECEVLLEQGRSDLPPKVCQTKSDLKKDHFLKRPENCTGKLKDAISDHPSEDLSFDSQESNMVGQFGTQPWAPGTGEFHTIREFDFGCSFASPTLPSPKYAQTENAFSQNVPDSFSLHLSSSDGCIESDLSISTLAIMDVMEKEAVAEDGNSNKKRNASEKEEDYAESTRVGSTLYCEKSLTWSKVIFTEIKNSTSISDHESKRLPLKEISANEQDLPDVYAHDTEAKEMRTADFNVIPCTPPGSKNPLNADFKTKMSATPLSSRKRHSPRHSELCSSPDEGLVIIDVAGHELVFEKFIEEWCSQSRFSLAVACERFVRDVPRIGGRFSDAPMSEGTAPGLKVEGEDQMVVGFAVSWGSKVAYYVSFLENNRSATHQPDNSQLEPDIDANLNLERRLEVVGNAIQFLTTKVRRMVCFDFKEHFKAFACSTGISLGVPAEDPKVASWLLDPGSKEKNLHQLVGQHLPEEVPILEGSGGGLGTGGLALAHQCRQSGRVRACVESVLVLGLMNKLRPLLKAEDLESAFTKVEMPSAFCLARMELNGIGFSETESEHLKNVLQAKLRALEQEAYRLANHSFSLTSREDVAQVLFVDLKLPYNGNTEEVAVPPRNTLGVTRRGTGRATRHMRTNKEVLERLKPLHPLPGLIVEWRRINSALTKVVFPFQRAKCESLSLNMARIHSVSQTHTATGRVSFAEPNLQNVPKTFDITLPTAIAESPPAAVRDSSKRGKKRISRQSVANIKPSMNSSQTVAPNYSVSMRNAFIPFKNGVLLAADYSQLELRLIAHLADDERLLRVLNAGRDVFKSIASELCRTPADSVNDDQRQRAKQVCYGIIYGIGAKALGEQLAIAEEDAGSFIDKFTSRYIGVRRFLRETVERCKKEGFVKTITGRKRFLPAINSTNAHAQSQAARQAVNTKVQGSAADLVKTAMIRIDKRLTEEFPTCLLTHRHHPPELSKCKGKIQRGHSKGYLAAPVGGYFILHLHDELIFEVSVSELRRVAEIVKTEMENVMKLSVELPVKMKAGPSWGNMAEFEL